MIANFLIPLTVLVSACSIHPDEAEDGQALPQAQQKHSAASQVAIIKADDFTVASDSMINPEWQIFVTYARDKGVKSSLGIIGLSFLAANHACLDTVKALSRSGMFEFWNHGFEHIINQTDSLGNIYSEFQGTDLLYQKLHLKATQKLIWDETHIMIKGFGAPGNQIDEVTTQIMEMKLFNLEYWFYGDEATTNVFVFNRTSKVENNSKHPDFDLFLRSYSPEDPYLILQIHPKVWSSVDYGEFDRIVDFLLEMDIPFVLPSEYLGLE